MRRCYSCTAPVNGLLYDPEKEIATLRQGIEMAPASGMLRNLYGYALLDAGEIDRSLAELEQYARLSPGEPNPYDSLGEANLAAMRPEKALEYYARANAIQPDFSAAGLALALAMLGRFDEIVAQPTQDSSIQHYTTQAVILSRTGRYREAELILATGRKRPEENKHHVGHAASLPRILDAGDGAGAVCTSPRRCRHRANDSRLSFRAGIAGVDGSCRSVVRYRSGAREERKGGSDGPRVV